MGAMKPLLMVFGCLALLASLGASQESAIIIQVHCPITEGCFRVIERAVEGAPSGAIIKIGAGLYYEKPLTIDKDLTLERAQEGPRPELRFIDPGAGITIQLSPDRETSMTVILRGLELIVPQDEGLLTHRNLSSGLEVFGTPYDQAQGGAPIDRLRVIIQDSSIMGYSGISAQGAHVTVEDSIINAISLGVVSRYSKLEINKSGISVVRATESDLAMALLHTQAWIQESQLAGGNFGILLAEGTKSTFVRNTMGRALFVGIYITDDAQVELNENYIVGNERYGIALPLAPCAAHPYIRFRGSVTGRDNEFTNNGQDLCPLDYPWPPGFKKP